MASEFLKARQTRYGAFVAFYLLVIIAIVIVANWLADHHNKTLDVTSNKQFTLSDQTKKVAGNLKKDDRSSNSTMREQLLDMSLAARRSDSTEELDRMQAEADGILRETLQSFEHGALAEGALTSFNIALGQFHQAVADRRALLMNAPQSLQRTGAALRAAGT